MEDFVIIVNGFQRLAIITKRSILDRPLAYMSSSLWEKVWQLQFRLENNSRYTPYCYLRYKVRVAQYNLLYNVLYLNQKLYKFGIVSCVKSFFYDIRDETPLPLFYECVYAQKIWNQLRLYLAWKIDWSVLTPHAIFGFAEVWFYHILLIFKYNIYNPRVNNILNWKSKAWNVLYLK